MINKCKRLLILLIFILNILVFNLLNVRADGEYIRNLSIDNVSITIGEETISNISTDPVSYYEEASSGYLNNYEIRYESISDEKSIIYTALYPLTKTSRVGNVVEYVFELSGSSYVVKDINNSGDGSTYIPVGGFVLSLRRDHGYTINVGSVGVLGGSKITIPTKAVESDSGKRIVINNTNVTRSAPMVVYYDYQYGEKTGTNVFGTEMTCVFDFELNTFKVTSFRGFGIGDPSGSDIPDNSFVLSAYGEGYRSLLVKNELFSIGDNVKMVGFDFIRFGGTVSNTYDYINPTKETNPKGMETETTPFAAFRGENQTIIYKDGWNYLGSSGTGTNVYGFEAAVDSNGIVVELAVNVSSIPEGGYVISGHGTGRDFIRSNMVLGATVELNEELKTFYISTTLNSYFENLVSSVSSSIKVSENRIKQLYDLDSTTITSYIEEINESIEQLRNIKIEIENNLDSPTISEEERLTYLMTYNNYQLKVEDLHRKIITTSSESKTVSARGVWHRPVEENYSEIVETINTYKECGINLIFVETLYNGYSAFKTDSVEFPYNPKLKTSYEKDASTIYNDYLTCFVEVAKEQGIEVHAWVENFYVGVLEDIPVINNHNDWLLYNEDNSIIQRNEGGAYIFIDPANKEVQDALIAYYNDLFVKVPDIAGLNLDYIRYPVTDMSEDSGYTKVAMMEFAEMKGLSFSEAQLSDRTKMAKKFSQLFDYRYLVGGEAEAKANYNDWVTYRTSKVTEFVKRIKTEVKDRHNIILSTAVFASINESLQTKKQDWATWFSNGWIDISTPMAYYTDPTDVLVNVQNMILSAGNLCYYYSGLASSFMGLPAWQNKEQIESSYFAGANGYVIFCSTQIQGHDDVQTVLKDGVNSKEAVLPHDSIDKVIKAYFDTIIDRANRIYIPNGGMDADRLESLEAKFNEITSLDYSDYKKIYVIKSMIEDIYNPAGVRYASGYSWQRITESLKELVSIIDVKMSLALIEAGEWNPEEEKVRPLFDENGLISEPIEPVEPVEPTEPEGPIVEPTNPKDNKVLRNTIIVLSIVSVVLVSSGVVLIILLKKRK